MIPTNDRGNFMLTNRQYEFVKKLVRVILPATATLYFALSAAWNLPATEQVIGTITALTTFLGVTMGISNKEYENSGAAYDGKMVVTPIPEDNKTVYNLLLEDHLENLEQKKSITLKVDRDHNS